MASSLTFRPDVFEMVSRVGRQIEEKLNSKEVFDKLTSRRRRIPMSSKPRERKLLPPQRLIAMLDKQQEADAHIAERTHKVKSDEDFVFRKQSRQDFYRATQKGEVVPPVGYYDPVFKSVEKASPNTSWSKQPKRNRKTLSLDEGAMKLGSERIFPIRATVTFDKQLPRKDSAQQSPHVHRWDNTRGSPLTDRVPVPDMSKALCRPEAFPGTRGGHPDYCPNFAPIWKRLSRNMFFAKTPGRKTPRPSSHDLVYENITYAQVHPKILTPAFGSSTQRDRDESPFPLFMRNLTSWQSTFSVNEKTLQMSGAIGKFPDPRQKKLRTGTHTATTSPTKRTDTQGMTNARSSSVASLSENR